MAATLPAGVFPTMITPFVEDGSAVDWAVLDPFALTAARPERSN